MNFIRAELIHKAFLMQPIKAFSFVHYNTNIKVSKNNDCLVVELVGRRGQKGLLEIFHDLYDLFRFFLVWSWAGICFAFFLGEKLGGF